MKITAASPKIFIIEDDPDQIDLLVNLTLNELRKVIDYEHTTDEQRSAIRSIQILKINDVSSLNKAAQTYKNVLLAVLDCNLPDTKDGKAHDQLIKTNHKITGQHKSVDILTKHLPDTPITMISSLNRFQKIVTRYYENTQGLDINFIRKHDLPILERNIGYYLRQHLREPQEAQKLSI